MNYPQFTTEELAAETWKPVVGFEGVYSVSDLGQVRREQGFRCRKTRVLKPGFNAFYFFVVLCVDGIHYTRLNHILTARAFIGVCPDKYEVNHIDGIKTNNRATNLEYLTSSQNQMHALDVLKVPNRMGEECRTAKLSEQEVISIRELYATEDYSLRTLANQFNVTTTSIHQIVSGRSWRRNAGPLYSGNKRLKPRLKPADVVEIRLLLTGGVSQQVIADRFQVTNSTVSLINTGTTWKHLL